MSERDTGSIVDVTAWKRRRDFALVVAMKSTQAREIRRAKELWLEWKRRQS